MVVKNGDEDESHGTNPSLAGKTNAPHFVWGQSGPTKSPVEAA